MSLPLKLNFSDYDNFLTDPNYTTSAEAQDYFRNMDMLVEALIDVGLWQPETNYPNGHVVFSPNMPNGAEAVCVATNGGKSSNVEPSWGEVGGDNINDGTCFWKLRWKHWSKSIEKIADLTTGATNRLPNKAYAVGNVVYTDSNLSVALKCTTAGTTSNTELDISGVSVGESVEDGSVVWEVVERYEDASRLANYPQRNTEYTLNAVVACPYHVEFLLKCAQAGTTSAGALDTTSVQTGQVLEDGGVKWKVIAKAIVDASISGTEITVTFADNTTKTLTTQDTAGVTPERYITTVYLNGKSWYEVYNDGWVRQGGFVTSGSSEQTITFLKPFKDTNYTVYGAFISSSSTEGASYRGVAIVKASSITSATSVTILNSTHGGKFWVAEGQGA